MNPPPVPGCLWAADRLLVRVRRAAKLSLPETLLRPADASQVACVVNLLSKTEYLSVGTDPLACPWADARDGRFDSRRRARRRIAMFYIFWPEPGELPSARQVRQAIDSIEDAHAIGLRVMVNGVGHPARAVMVAGCLLAREGYSGDLEDERLRWLEEGVDHPADWTSRPRILSAAERALITGWPSGRKGQPELVDMEWSERDEVFPTATINYWLGKLRTVRVYLGARGKTGPVEVPVVDGQRVSDGADIDLDLDELRRGVWIGERTLRLPNGWQVVFVSPFR